MAKKIPGPETAAVHNRFRLTIKREKKRTYQLSTFGNCKEAEMRGVSFQERDHQQAE